MKTLWILLALGLLGWAGWKFTGGFGAARAATIVPESLFTVKQGELTVTVTENGYLKAKDSVNVSPEFQREATITWIVAEGKAVEEGEVLAEFDKTELESQVDDIEKQLLQAQNEQEAATAELEIQKRDSEAAIQSADFNLKVVRLKLERHVKGDAPNEVRKLDLSVEKAQSEHARANERYQTVPKLEKEGFMTKIQAEQERIRLKEAEINLESVRRERELYQIYSEPMDRAQLEVNVKDAERLLINAREKAEISVKEKETRESRAGSQLRQTELRLEKLKKELSKMTVKAPRPGIVHYGDAGNPWDREEVKVGAKFYRGNTLFTLPDLREMQVLIQIHEADIDLVKLDQPVVVTVESAKDRTFTGKVTRINPVADSNWMDENNKRFGCEVTLDPIDVALRAGISAKVEVQVEELQDVLFVPIHAVFAEGGDTFCFTPQGQAWQKRPVKLGKNNAHYVVTLEGLAEGDKLLLYDPRESEASEGGPTGASKGTNELTTPATNAPTAQ